MSNKGNFQQKIKSLEEEVIRLQRELQGVNFNTQRELQRQMDMIPFEATGSPKANSKTYDTNYSAPKKSTMVGGISIPTLNLH